MATTLNRHVHQLTADHTSYNREMSKSAKSTKGLAQGNQSLVSSIALVDGPLGGVASRASNLNSIFTKGGLALGAFAIGVSGLGFGLAKTLTVMSSVETEMAKIDNLIRATGGSTGLLAEEFDSMARSVALDTLASTNDIRQAIASLMTFRSVGSESFERTIRLSQDMAAVWGGSAATNARKLGKSLEDPIKQLSRLETTVGAFDTTSREAILTMAKSGDKAGAQAKILETLEKRIKGAGNALGLPGVKDTLAQRWEEFFEAVNNSLGVGKKAETVLNRMAIGLNNISNAIDPSLEAQISDKYQELNLLALRKGAEIAKLEELKSKSNPFGLKDPDIQGQQKLVDLIETRRTELEKEISTLRARSEAKNDDLFLDKLIAQGSEKYFKIQQEGIAKQLKDKQELDELQKMMDEGSIIRFNMMGKAAEEEIKKQEALRQEFLKLRETGLTDLEKENELHKNNVVFLEDYTAKIGQTAQIRQAMMAEELRHVEKLNELNLDKDFDFLSGRMGEAANDELGVDSMERENEQHKLRMEQLWQFGMEELANTQAIDKLIEQEKERHGKAVTDIKINEERQIALAKASFWSASISLMGSQSRKLFELGKVAAISNAIVSATEAVPHAWNWGMKIGGPPLAGAFAAASVAATAVQIQSINSTQFGGGSASAGIGSVATAEPAFQAPTDNRKEVNFIFNGNIAGHDADHIANMLKEHIDSTDFVLIEPASRNGQELVA